MYVCVCVCVCVSPMSLRHLISRLGSDVSLAALFIVGPKASPLVSYSNIERAQRKTETQENQLRLLTSFLSPKNNCIAERKRSR